MPPRRRPRSIWAWTRPRPCARRTPGGLASTPPPGIPTSAFADHSPRATGGHHHPALAGQLVSDTYNWASDPTGNANFRNLATNVGAQVFIIANYGSGTPKQAAAWVLAENKTNNCNFQYWEVGNEFYGSWEHDTHAIQHDPYTYATNAVAFI